MATPVVQNVQTAASDASSTLTITKPTGLAVGDLMVAKIFNYDASPVTPNDETGWTSIHGANNTVFGGMKAYWKIADSSDVSASNFTFDLSASKDSVRGFIMRITGHYASAPIGSNYVNALTSSTTTPSWSPTFTPYTADALLILAIFSQDAAGAPVTIGSYTVSGTNPTWTEQYENTESTDHILGVATGTATSADNITSISATLSQSCSRHIVSLLSIPSATAVTATPASIAIKTAQSAPTVQSAVTATPASIAIRAQQSDPTPTAKSNRWVNRQGGDYDWTNLQKQ